jgi:hypothetical protein
MQNAVRSVNDIQQKSHNYLRFSITVRFFYTVASKYDS